MMKKTVFAAGFGLLLLLFTSYVLLDTFVIVRRYATVEAPATEEAVLIRTDSEATASEAAQIRTETPSGAADASILYEAEAEQPTQEADTSASSEQTAEESSYYAAEPVYTDTSYRDESISVQLAEYRICDTTVYVADVRLASAELLKTAFAQNTYGRNVTEKTSVTAASVDAILAINGDYYGARQSGYVIRDGVVYRSTAAKGNTDLVIYGDGSFAIVKESDVSAEELAAGGAETVLSFGPALIENGEIAVGARDEVGQAMASNPRTAIARIDDLHYLFVVSDGRTSQSEGLSLYELAAFLQTLGAETAYNLDGGGSSTMVFNGEIVNNPTSNGRSKERSVSDIVYIGY